RLAGPLLAVALATGCAPSADAPDGAATPVKAPANASAETANDPSHGGAREGNWVRAESERQGLPLVWEYRDDYAVVPPRRLPQLLVVSLAREVPYVGQTIPELQREFDAHERQLRTALGADADLVAVLDWHRQHDWFFYADASVTQDRVAAALGDLRRGDVRVTLENDAQKFYSTLKQRVSAGQ
ncbi:hypothetical protein, partial [Tahibacter caeni]|uniref:hypothetical protein n=1 Tax=Tahibacter caeni TaxID=1453545 RepID=UPI0021491C90